MTHTPVSKNRDIPPHRHSGARASANPESRDSGSGAGAPSRNDGATNLDQDQFLTILSREDALARFEAALFPRAVAGEPRLLADALGCALAEDIVAPIDVPPFDRSNVDGFAVRSADLASATEAHRRSGIVLNDEVIACGTAPARPVLSGTATTIATGGPVPRGADADRDGRAHPARRIPRDRNPPRRFARTIRLLCRLRHRARRGAAARRHRRSARARSACWRRAGSRR